MFKRSLRAGPKGGKGLKGPKKIDTGLRPGHRFDGEVRDLRHKVLPLQASPSKT